MDADLAAAVDRALDARRDPLDDDEVLARLAERPEALAELERLLARLARIERGAAGPAPRAGDASASTPRAGARPGASTSTRRGAWRRVAAALLVAAGAWSALHATHEPEPSPPARHDATSRAAPTVASPVPPDVAPDAHAPAPAAGARGRVLSARFTTVVRGPAGTSRTVTDADGRRTERASSGAAHPSLVAWSETWPRR